MTRAAVFGTGNWGTAFSLVLADAGTEAVLCGRRAELAERINRDHENAEYLPGITLPGAVRATTDPDEALSGADFLVLTVPAQSLREILARLAPMIGPQTVLVSLMKGIELGTCMRMSEVIAEVTGAGPDRIAVVSGPNLAQEIAERHPAASVVACADQMVAEQLQKACHSQYFRPYTNTDVIGCELGGAVKNVIGLGCRDRRRHGARRQHQGLADHPRTGRDRAARRGAGRRSVHVFRSGRARRPGGHLCLAALP